MAMTGDEIYEQHIQPLSPEERLRLAARMAGDLANGADGLRESQGKRSLLELEGVGAELWEGIDAQEYVNELRDEWSPVS